MGYGYDIQFMTVFLVDGKYYRSSAAAQATYPSGFSIIRLQAISIDDQIYTIDPVQCVDDVRARALSKLTDEERDALGVK